MHAKPGLTLLRASLQEEVVLNRTLVFKCLSRDILKISDFTFKRFTLATEEVSIHCMQASTK